MSLTAEPIDDDLIDLEPTVQLGPEAIPASPGLNFSGDSSALASSDPGSLRRARLAGVALLFSVVYLIMLLWTLEVWAKDIPLAWVVMASRLALSVVVLGLLLSPLGTSPLVVRGLEIALFLGLSALLVFAQYRVESTLLERGNLIGAVAFFKNGVIQAILLILIYGTFIPNRPAVVAWVSLAMAMAPLMAFALVSERTDIAEAVARFQTAERTGSNLVVLLITVGIAVFGSVTLNGLRAQLHEARKFGQYRLVNRIGAGGMGEVYLAEHALLKRPCALKLIRSESGGDPTALARFEREVQSSARLQHHNTISIYDYGHTDDGTFYYVMEYLSGMSLADLVIREGHLPPGRVVYLFRQVCAGLAEAHGLGLVHRDLKPANVFVAKLGGETDVAKVLDFGLVKVTREPEAVALTADLTISGTPLYMAPEQATGDRDLDARADVYALGAMMYQALTGRPPFSGATPLAVLMAHARDTVVPPSQVQPGIPDDLEAIVLRCLAKSPSDRFPDVRSLGDALSLCSCAGEWGPRQADAWWSRSAPAIAPEMAEATSASS